MKRIILSIIALSIFVLPTYAQLNTNLLGQLSYNQNLSDIWAWVDNNGTEYALVATVTGLSIVNVNEPANPFEVAFVPGINSTWGDIKTLNGFAYVINEEANGLMIVDLNNLPDAPSINFLGSGTHAFTSSHNVYIDEFGYMYIFGANNGSGGALIYDINEDPWSPDFVGRYDASYIHDGYVRDNIMYACQGNNFAIVNVADKTNPIVLGTQGTYGYTHNGWLSDDSQTLFTTDETSGTWVVAWDINDPTDIKELDKWQSSPGQNVIPHNTHVLNDFLVTSYYTDGVTITDASNPSILVQTGFYDTSPNSGDGFNGCWGTTPFLPSGNIIASDVQQGLFVIGVDYVRASYVEGVVTDNNSGNVLNDVTINIQANSVLSSNTNVVGYYADGVAETGDIDIVFSKAGYSSQTHTVNFQSGVTAQLDVDLVPMASFALQANVVDNVTGAAIENASIIIVNDQFNYAEITDSNGNIDIATFFEGDYTLYAGQWGYVTQAIENTVIDPNNNTISIELEQGYYDDFTLDFGWQSTGNASSGAWELGVPIGTNFNGTTSNPGNDVGNDIGESCYVTGNGGGGAGTDDVDNGSVLLTSPIFDLTIYEEGTTALSYSRWFFNEGGQGTAPNDQFTISLSNGTETVVLETIASSNNTWSAQTHDIDAVITPSSTMQLILETADDQAEGHIVEAAFDHFQVSGTIIEDTTTVEPPVGINDEYDSSLITLSENPFNNEIQITVDANKIDYNTSSLAIYTVDGKFVSNLNLTDNTINWGKNAATGVYVLSLVNEGKIMATEKLIKTNF